MPLEKPHAHPAKSPAVSAPAQTGASDGAPWSALHPYAELAITSNFTFLAGASHPEELVTQAHQLGHRAASIADTNTFAGIVRAHVAAKDAGIPLAIGTRLVLTDPAGMQLLAFASSRTGYRNLCRLLTLGKRRAPKGSCELRLHDVIEHQRNVLCVMIPPATLDQSVIEQVQGLARVFDRDRFSLALCRPYGPDDNDRLRQVSDLANLTSVPIVAINDVHYHTPARRMLQDVLTCIHHGTTIERAGLLLAPNAERHLKAPHEMHRIFAEYPKALARSVEVALRAAQFSLDELRYEYPSEPCPDGMTPATYLAQLCEQGTRRRYPQGVPDKVRTQLTEELALIGELGYEPYFLTCADLVAFARSRGILCQGRGGAANSSVCYVLGITEVDPAKFQLLFARFISRARNEPPDIDIDFEHERREEVLQYLYAKYGRERAALTAEVISYRARSAVRDVGKAMGLSQDAVDALAKSHSHWGEAPTPGRVREAGFNPSDPTLGHVLELSRQLMGFPRHLSQHVGGMVITRTALCDLVPIENAAMDDRTVIEWDKDDIDALGMLKVDCLGLGMLTCIRKCFSIINESSPPYAHHEPLSFASVPKEDPDVYAMIQKADTIGVFQIESRAQMSMLPRLKPACFYDLVIEVAIVRPGPIQGKMVHPYLRRRTGEEPVVYPNPEIEDVLSRTLGVPLFQEQAMQLAIVAGGFSSDDADRLRRAMAAWKRKTAQFDELGRKLVAGMLQRGYAQEFALRVLEQIKGFSEYGFPESHAASFALLVYVSCWLKHHKPAAFCAALLNSQPMGFYAPAQIIRDAQNHGVTVLAVDANRSQWDCTIEHDGASVRLGTRMVRSVRECDGLALAQAVKERGPFASLDELWRERVVSVACLRRLARAEAFRSMGLDRQRGLWQVRKLRDESLPLFDHLPITRQQSASTRSPSHDDDSSSALPVVPKRLRMLDDFESTGVSLRAHPLSFIRASLTLRGCIPASELRDAIASPHGRHVMVAGVVLVRQRPATASGIVFMTLEDETGMVNLIVRPHIFERFRKAARLSTIVLAYGRVERQGVVVHVQVGRIVSLDEHWERLPSQSRDFH
jgi:error-prone DNA polymerase